MAEVMRVMLLAVLESNSNLTSWIAIFISALALIGTLGNFVFTWWRGRRRVTIKSSVAEDLPILMGTVGTSSSTYVPSSTFVYRCKVTNTGYIGLQIERVELRPAEGGTVKIVLELAPYEQPRKLDQGESQDWEKGLDEIKGMLRSEQRIEVIAAAVDTTGKEYVQKRKDSLPIHLD